ncbi:hypothetical protein KIN20_009760, partial [Parelaphostrongylus tenuis]
RYLASGYIRNYPRSNNMSYLFYNCALENFAYEIAKSCERGNQLDFHHAGSNIAFFDGRDYFDEPEIAIDDAIDRWWETGKKYDAPKNIIPSVDDKSRAPFFQMANGATTKFGCAYQWCNCTSHSPFVYIAGVPLYTKGEPCDLCGGKEVKDVAGEDSVTTALIEYCSF